MSIISQLAEVKKALTGIDGLKVSHYEAAPRTEVPYCVWAEDGEEQPLDGDNYKVRQQIQGTIDLYTKTDLDPLADAIQSALNDARIGFYLNSVQYEDETGYIHWEWVFNV